MKIVRRNTILVLLIALCTEILNAQNTDQFYKIFNGGYAWMNDSTSRNQLLAFIKEAPGLGLNEKDYDIDFMTGILNNDHLFKNGTDSMMADIRLTDAAIHFFKEVAFGNRVPETGYNGLKYQPGCFDIPSLLANALITGRFGDFLNDIELQSPEYLAVKKKLVEYTSITRDTLINKVPLPVRIKELTRAINTIRWLRCARQQWPHIIVVNIPAAWLFVYNREHITMATEVIVGKQSTRTPMFISKVTEVILYPYWMVPPKIASRELLPLIKKNISYLSANNMQVINQHGKIVNPRTINWELLSSNNFPYTLRQSTGCDNSLGIVKLNFYSPYGVYLHDTPWKMLFNLNKRYFSHGCIRVNKAMELARLVLKDNTIAIDTLEEKGCLNNQRPIIVPATEPMPVFVLYNTAWVDPEGVVRFYDNVYNKE